MHRQRRGLSIDATSSQTAESTGGASAVRLSEELYSMLTNKAAKPDDASVMEKIEELEVRASTPAAPVRFGLSFGACVFIVITAAVGVLHSQPCPFYACVEKLRNGRGAFVCCYRLQPSTGRGAFVGC